MMNRPELIDRMRRERQGWNLLLLEAGEDRLEELLPGGEWTLKDIVAHITAYEYWLAGWLEASRRGALPADSITTLPDMDERNAIIFSQNHLRLPEDVLTEAGWVFDRLIKAVHSLPDAELDNPALSAWYVKPYWDENTPVWKCIAGDSYEHYHEHIPQIRKWLDETV
ncbi:ClbS/DfsB family four-helix bundle protein [bacterium]|nr:MAG: ClbS/DfsB family four-helix bundle protein [bacterium]